MASPATVATRHVLAGMPSPVRAHDEAHLQHPATTGPCCASACVLALLRLGRSPKALGLLAAALAFGELVCVHFSGFVHDFNKVPRADWYKSDIALTVCAVSQCGVLLRIPAVVRRLRHRRYALVGAAERRGCGWSLNLLFLLLFLGGFCNRVRGGMLGPVWGLCDSANATCDGYGDFVGRLSMSIPTGILVGALAGNGWLGLWFAWFMYLGNVPDWGCCKWSSSLCVFFRQRSCNMLRIRLRDGARAGAPSRRGPHGLRQRGPAGNVRLAHRPSLQQRRVRSQAYARRLWHVAARPRLDRTGRPRCLGGGLRHDDRDRWRADAGAVQDGQLVRE